MLAPLLKKDREYAKFFRDVEGYRILDNGVAEGERMSLPDIAAIAKDYDVEEIVVPDFLSDTNRTIKAARAFERFAVSGKEYMGVVQGNTAAELIKCATALSFLDYITVLGLPRVMSNIHRGMRATFAETLTGMYDRQMPFHCLGSTNDPREVVTLLPLKTVRSMDTCMPISMGFEGKSVRIDTYEKRVKDYFKLEVPSKSKLDLISDNIRTFLDWGGAEPIV